MLVRCAAPSYKTLAVGHRGVRGGGGGGGGTAAAAATSKESIGAATAASGRHVSAPEEAACGLREDGEAEILIGTGLCTLLPLKASRCQAKGPMLRLRVLDRTGTASSTVPCTGAPGAHPHPAFFLALDTRLQRHLHTEQAAMAFAFKKAGLVLGFLSFAVVGSPTLFTMA